ncbi:protein of unknown function [Magnetospirillum gryphiswaldense MSR-1 v2]|uniref:Uncharacterized protein n=2 Tax=Magnetospirillum gryphiswaldense TaxID=55518 RepID=V6F8I2_MAGGM|nr:protein of unknown function [Magnetospirillum gryphiswaldense MSR-1 v2]
MKMLKGTYFAETLRSIDGIYLTFTSVFILIVSFSVFIYSHYFFSGSGDLPGVSLAKLDNPSEVLAQYWVGAFTIPTSLAASIVAIFLSVRSVQLSRRQAMVDLREAAEEQCREFRAMAVEVVNCLDQLAIIGHAKLRTDYQKIQTSGDNISTMDDQKIAEIRSTLIKNLRAISLTPIFDYLRGKLQEQSIAPEVVKGQKDMFHIEILFKFGRHANGSNTVDECDNAFKGRVKAIRNNAVSTDINNLCKFLQLEDHALRSCAPPYMDALKNSLASSGQSYGYEYPGLGLEMLISKLAECRRIYDESNKINELTKSIREFVDHFSIQHESFKDSFKKYLCSVDTYVDGDYTDNEIVNKLLKYTKDEFDSFLSEHGHEVGDEIEDDEADAFITSRIDELKEGWGLTQLEEEISRLEKITMNDIDKKYKVLISKYDDYLDDVANQSSDVALYGFDIFISGSLLTPLSAKKGANVGASIVTDIILFFSNEKLIRDYFNSRPTGTRLDRVDVDRLVDSMNVDCLFSKQMKEAAEEIRRKPNFIYINHSGEIDRLEGNNKPVSHPDDATQSPKMIYRKYTEEYINITIATCWKKLKDKIAKSEPENPAEPMSDDDIPY